MKKFKFTLQSVYDYKQTVEKQQKAAVARAEGELRLLEEQEIRLIEDFARVGELRERTLERRVGIIRELADFEGFFLSNREQRDEVAARIVRATEIRDNCREQLIETMKEIKGYEKLLENQLLAYKKELADEEEREISDIVSFKSAVG